MWIRWKVMTLKTRLLMRMMRMAAVDLTVGDVRLSESSAEIPEASAPSPHSIHSVTDSK